MDAIVAVGIGVEDRVRLVIASVLDVEIDQVQPMAKLVENLKAESGNFLTLQFDLETEFEVAHGTFSKKLTPDQVVSTTVADVINFIKERVQPH